MKNLVRGGVVAILASFCFVYAQAPSADALAIANDSQTQFNNDNIETVEMGSALVTEAGDMINAEMDKAAGGKAGAELVSGMNKGMFSATAYCLKGRTALGHSVRRGIVAADPRILKLGSRIGLSAGNYSGTYLVSDTGGAIKGRKLDIWVPSCSEAVRFGRRSVGVSQL